MLKIWFDLEFDLADSRILGNENPTIWLDIETRKISCENWHQKSRWQPFMVAICGVSDPGIFFCCVVSGTETDLITFLSQFEDYEIRYEATREFDEMVLRGRFTNARRAHSPYCGNWPNLDSLPITWKNLRKTQKPKSEVFRKFDLLSKDVPLTWTSNPKLVAIHCKNDVIETFLRDIQVSVSPELGKILCAELATV